MILALKGHYNRRIWDWEELEAQFDLNCSWKTIRRQMNNAGYHKCRACQRDWIAKDQAEKRVTFSADKKEWPEWRWKEVNFSDETHFHQNSRHTAWVIRNSKEKHCPDCIQKRKKTAASQFHCWSMIGFNYKGPLIFYGYAEEVEKQQKNGKVKETVQQYQGSLFHDCARHDDIG